MIPGIVAGARQVAGGGGDPDFANVNLLLHMDGTNGSTTFTDNSGTPKTMTVNGNAQISTAQSKFGGASGLFDGTGDFLSHATAAAWHLANGDFTIEAWARPTLDLTRIRIIAATRADNPTTNGWEFGISATNKLFFNGYSAGSAPISVTSFGDVAANVWTHVAVSRVGSNCRLFIDGVADGIDSSLSAMGQGGSLNIGRMVIVTSRDWPGYLDDVRITIGVGRYTSNFTPPTAAFPNF